MKNSFHSPMGPLPERDEQAVQQAERETSKSGLEAQMLLDYVIEMGFGLEEAVKLIHLREHLYENIEMHQRIADDSRVQFARWLYEQGEIGEE